MSISIETLIYCDGPTWICKQNGAPLSNGDDRGRTAKEQLRGSDWVTVKRGVHLCPVCAEAYRKGEF